MRVCLFFLAMLVSGCASTHVVSRWKNPDIVLFDAYKVLVVGMAQDQSIRQEFETRMQAAMASRGIEAVRSIDLFDVAFTNASRSEEELSEVESQLLDRDFDAILFTKVIGSENRRTFRKSMAELDGFYYRFREDYLNNQRIYYDVSEDDTYKVYHAETSLYCICVGKDRELIWRGIFDVNEPDDPSKTIDQYIKLLIREMAAEDVLFREEHAQTTSAE